MTASIYTVQMLRAYLQGKISVLNVHGRISESATMCLLAKLSVYEEVIALCEGIEAYEAACYGDVVKALRAADMIQDTPND